MNRQDIIDRMALREKEIFKKYENTYPFPIRKFIEEIGIEIIEEEEIDNRQHCTLSKEKTDRGARYKIILTKTGYEKDFAICTRLMHYLFDSWDDKDIRMVEFAFQFLLPRHEFSKIKTKVMQSKPYQKKIAKRFGVPQRLLEFFADKKFSHCHSQ